MDPYTDPDSLAEDTINAMAVRLEERGAHPIFKRFTDQYADSLSRETPLKILELGCGTGAALRRLQQRLHPDSTLIGADISAKLLARARRIDPNDTITWIQVAKDHLPFEDSSFDAILMHTLLSHVPDPTSCLRQADRLLKENGTLVLFDADHASTTFGQPDYALMRKTDHLLSSSIATNPDICRQIPRLLKNSGLTLQKHYSETISECGRGDFWLSSVRGYARLIPALGILPNDEAEAWTSHMLKSHDSGTFFAAGTFYTFIARKQALR